MAVTYSQFIRDVAAGIVKQLKDSKTDPEFVSQRTAYRMFGRRNVERWRRQGKVKFYKRPGKVEYRTSELRLLQNTEQDYFTDIPPVTGR